jgi:2-methylisocitrate lyase-like PEP mutase family enzyme
MLTKFSVGVATMNDMRDHAAMIASIDPTIPLVADADTGYGGKPLFAP